jgi:hypothetical protein
MKHDGIRKKFREAPCGASTNQNLYNVMRVWSSLLVLLGCLSFARAAESDDGKIKGYVIGIDLGTTYS